MLSWPQVGSARRFSTTFGLVSVLLVGWIGQPHSGLHNTLDLLWFVARGGIPELVDSVRRGKRLDATMYEPDAAGPLHNDALSAGNSHRYSPPGLTELVDAACATRERTRQCGLVLCADRWQRRDVGWAAAGAAGLLASGAAIAGIGFLAYKVCAPIFRPSQAPAAAEPDPAWTLCHSIRSSPGRRQLLAAEAGISEESLSTWAVAEVRLRRIGALGRRS